MKITHRQFFNRIDEMADEILEKKLGVPKVFGIPTGGVFVAYSLQSCLAIEVVDDVKDADIIVDDILDSGRTMSRYSEMNPKAICLAAYNSTGHWITFPWDKGENESALDIPTRLLQFIGEDVTRGGLQDTPMRFLKAWKDWTSGYGQDPQDQFKAFEDGAENYDEMIILKDIPVYSQCEHHLAPFFGEATVAYIPDKKIIGLSKISRMVDIYARRLQVQERLTTDIANCINDMLGPIGVGVIVKCRHLCMESRGINRKGIITTTSALMGWFKERPEVRQEFLRLAGD